MTLSSLAWTDILQTIIKSPAERQRLATLLGVTPITLGRWASGETTPQLYQLARLVKVVQPQVREELLAALEVLYPDIERALKDAAIERIPASFFAEVLSTRTTTTESLRFWRMSEMVLKQALDQLDPNGLGMAISVVQCMPPVDGRIRSLRETVGKGTLPWSANLDNLALFLGMESLAGYCVETRHVVSVEDLSQDKLVPAYQTEFETSAAAHPIWLGGLIAGCLLVSSTQIGYFSQQRLTLLATFSDLISLAFSKDDFYPPNMVALHVLPQPDKQRPILATFRQRVSKALVDAMQERRHISNGEAERKVWQEIEEELLSLPDD
jgi:transcriptional regulator with XRE-family HTH domain